MAQAWDYLFVTTSVDVVHPIEMKKEFGRFYLVLLRCQQ